MSNCRYSGSFRSQFILRYRWVRILKVLRSFWVVLVGWPFKILHFPKIWDTSGASKYFSIIKNYYRGVHGILLVYDVKSQKSFDNIRTWMKSITEYANTEVEIYLIANKCDFNDTVKRRISKFDGEKLAESYGIKYIETSAKSNLNIDNTFIEITKSIKNKLDKKQIDALLTMNNKAQQVENLRKSSTKRKYLNKFRLPPNNAIKTFNQNLNRKLVRIFGCFPIKAWTGA